MGTSMPSFYRIFFTTIDPLIALSGVFGYLTAPDALLDSFNPRATLPPTLETRVLVESGAGSLLAIAFLQVVLLRLRARDLAVWRCLQTSIGILDVTLIVSALRALADQGRIEPGQWRWQESSSMALTSTVLLIRVLFVLGLGLSREAKSKET